MVAPAIITPNVLRPYLQRCGYDAARLAADYRFGEAVVPLAGFFGRPFDTRSACLAVVEAQGDTRAAAAKCIPLGAPTSLVCNGHTLEWWGLLPTGPGEMRPVSLPQLNGFFDTHAKDLAPTAIYGAKLRRPMAASGQMWFVDIGLMPAVEKRAGEALHRLVEGVIQGLAERLGRQLERRDGVADAYKTIFWLLAAKLLHDKGVDNFRRIDLGDVDDVFRRVGRHYADVDDLPPGGKAWRPAIDEAAQAVAGWGHLGNVSTESLAYLYETGLIDSAAKGGRDIRKELGIHSTPSVLVDYMLAQLWPWVEQQPVDKRYVFEPACGQASFLVAAMRWLRDFSGISEGPERHRYLRSLLHGIEIDPFASELAKLSLTLADVPYGNSWRVETRDMFDSNCLARGASECALLLANPPYEVFASAERRAYERAGFATSAQTKAVEMLKRTLPQLRPGSVFGIVVPQGTLHDSESRSVREILLHECELMEVDVFADNLFEQADHEVAVLMGRRRTDTSRSQAFAYRRVRERGMSAFKERLAFSSERRVAVDRIVGDAALSLLLPDLAEVWDYMADQGKLSERIDVQKGREYWKEEKLEELGLVSSKRRAGWQPAVLRADDDYEIWSLPQIVWVDPSPAAFRPRGGGAQPGTPQIILNYARVAREPWRLKAVIDNQGLAISSRFVAFRPKPGGPTLKSLWAVLNSPVANAYAYCFSGKRETLVKEWRAFPLPAISPAGESAIAAAADHYLALVKAAEDSFMQNSDRNAIRSALRAVDAEVLRLYDLPPRLERQLLDLFAGVERKGVGCEFGGYYPEGLDAFVPLHELLSEEYSRSTAENLRRSHVPLTQGSVLNALRMAASQVAEG